MKKICRNIHNALTKRIEFIGWISYLLFTIFTAVNISSIRYGSPDDLALASFQFSNTGIIKNAISSAEETGRIQ